MSGDLQIRKVWNERHPVQVHAADFAAKYLEKVVFVFGFHRVVFRHCQVLRDRSPFTQPALFFLSRSGRQAPYKRV